MKTETIKLGILTVLQFLWSQRKLILALIPLVIEAQQKYVTGADKKAWVMDQVAAIKGFTPDDVDKAIDYVVQILQAMRIL